jgi:hypothetical protein
MLFVLMSAAAFCLGLLAGFAPALVLLFSLLKAVGRDRPACDSLFLLRQKK